MNAYLDEPVIEPERYEFSEETAKIEWSRRDFFRIAGSGLVVALLLDSSVEAQPPRQGGRGGAGPQEIGAWIHIGEDSSITVFTGKVEIGQNLRTSFTQVVAEELHAGVKSIKIVMADTAVVPFDAGTFGSSSTPRMASQLRRAAAAAREALIDLAAEQGKIERSSFTLRDGKVSGPEGKPEFTFGQLTKGQKLMKVIAADVSTTKAEKWTVAGTSLPKVGGQEFVTGKHQYASDIHRPDMVFGKILRPTAFKAKLISLDSKDAEAKTGVKVVSNGDFVGVIAPTEYAATEAISLLKAEWQTTPQISDKELFTHLKEKAGRSGGGTGGGGGAGFGNRGSSARFR